MASYIELNVKLKV